MLTTNVPLENWKANGAKKKAKKDQLKKKKLEPTF
jgi:hypothetical protein